jgi:hypothetical protein
MAVVVDTIHGRLEGLQEEDLQSFRGIPFAKSIFDREPGVSLAPFDAECSAWDGLV